MHHRNLLPLSVDRGKISVADLILEVDILPLGIEKHRVYEVHYGIIVYFVEHILYHTVGSLLCPTVDVVAGFLIERSLVYICSIVVGVFLKKIALYVK